MNEQEILDLMKRRQSTRRPFDADRPIDPAVLRMILEAATWAPTAHNMQNFEIVAVDDKSVLTQLSELKSAVSSVFIQENYEQLSFTEDELKEKKTGIYAGQFPPAWLAPLAREGKLEQPPEKLGEQVRNGPVLLLILYDPSRRAPASEGDFLGVMSLGFMLENMWLIAAAQGVGFHIISPLGNEPLASEIKEMLNIPAPLRLTLGVRLGYPAGEDIHLRVRRDVEDFASHNQYKSANR